DTGHIEHSVESERVCASCAERQTEGRSSGYRKVLVIEAHEVIETSAVHHDFSLLPPGQRVPDRLGDPRFDAFLHLLDELIQRPGISVLTLCHSELQLRQPFSERSIELAGERL